MESKVNTPGKRFWILVISLIFLLIAGITAYQMLRTPDLPKMWKINDFTLDSMEGKPFNFSDTDGKLRFVSFIYTNCPDVCPVTTHYTAQLQDKLKSAGLFGSNIVFLSVAFDPERDTPEALHQYANRFNADTNGWYFVRGDEQKVQDVAKMFKIGVQKANDGLYLHTMKTFLVDGEGNVRKMYGMAADMNLEEIQNDIEQLAD